SPPSTLVPNRRLCHRRRLPDCGFMDEACFVWNGLSTEGSCFAAADHARLSDVQCWTGLENLTLKSGAAKEVHIAGRVGRKFGYPNGLYFCCHTCDAALV